MKLKFLLWILIICITGNILAQDGGIMQRLTLTHDDTERNFLLYQPANYDENKAYSLLLALHPASTTADQMADMTAFERLADRHDVVMIFPNAIGARWNSSGANDVDDLGFLTALLDRMIADYAIDESRIFVLGYSSGGLMTLKLRCELSDRLAGIISYAAPMTVTMADTCLSADPVASLTIHGTADEVFPYNGQVTVTDGTLSGTFSADQTIGFLAGLNGCSSQRQVSNITPASARNSIFQTSYPCETHITQLYTVDDLGHFGWAGTIPLQIDDRTMTLNEAIFEFIRTVGENNT